MTDVSPPIGYVHVRREKVSTWIPLLKRIYEFEATRIEGAGSSHRDIRRVLWFRGELAAALELPPGQERELDELLGELQKSRQLLRVPQHDDVPAKYISRVAETIRLLGHSYEYWYQGRPGIDAVRWLIEPKQVPKRDVLASEFFRELSESIRQGVQNAEDAQNLVESTRIVLTGVGRRMSRGDWSKARFARFQVDSTIAILLRQFGHDGPAQKAQILTAGVGAGKTLAFGLATLISAVNGIRRGEAGRGTTLLVYPRVALAQDQRRVMAALADSVGLPDLTVLLDHNVQFRLEGLSVKAGIERYYRGPSPPPAIIITTFETLKRRLQHPLFIQSMNARLTTVVVDEIHLATGLVGGHISGIMRRLRTAVHPRKLVLTAASATVARPDEHAGRVFGIDPKDVTVTIPAEETLDTVGLAHHVFLRPSGLISPLGALVNATSLLVHSRRDWIGYREGRQASRQKSIGFADDLDTLGRWNADLRENERTEEVEERPHPECPCFTDWPEPRQREIPYSLRFQRPLQRRIKEHGGLVEPLPTVFGDLDVGDVCSKCRDGQRIQIKEHVSRGELKALSRVVYRVPTLQDDLVRAYWISNPVFEEDDVPLGTLDLCPYLRAGACLWFPRDDAPSPSDGAVGTPPLSTQRLPGTSPPRYDWRETATSLVHTSKSPSTEGGDDLADVVFKGSVRRLYGVPPDDNSVPVDIVLASPTLEVGVDLPLLTESMMTKAIRNVASYRQKAGRTGREEGLDVLNVTLVHDTPIDLHYYRQPRKLVSQGRLDPIPLKDRNEAIVGCSAYLAVWDWLALRTDLPEAIPEGVDNEGKSRFTERLRPCLAALSDAGMRAEVVDYVRRISPAPRALPDSVIEAAISQSIEEIGFLLSPVAGTLSFGQSSPSVTLADVVVFLMLGQRRGGRSVSPAHPRETETLDRFIDEALQCYRRLEGVQGPAAGIARPLMDWNHSGGWSVPALNHMRERLLALLPSIADLSAQADVEDLANRWIPRIAAAVQHLLDLGSRPQILSAYRDVAAIAGSWKIRYLSSLMQSLTVLEPTRKRTWFVRPQNLYSNPYANEVGLMGISSQEQDSVPISEALFGYIPGTWTYRHSQDSYKVKTGALRPEAGGLLVADIRKIERAGNVFEKVATGLNPPPGLRASLDVYRPVRLALLRNRRKYVLVDRGRGVVVDDDEASGRGNAGERPVQVKVPKSYLNRWTSVVVETSVPSLPLDPDEGVLSVDTEDGSKLIGADALNQIRHPLFGTHLREAQWHDKLRVTEYVYSATRSYTGAGGEGFSLSFQDSYANPVAFGQALDTEGLSFVLNDETVRKTIETVNEGMQKGDGRWTPSVLSAFKAFSAEIPGPTRGPAVGSPFLIDDIVSVLLGYIANEAGPVALRVLVAGLVKLAEDPALSDIARSHYLKRYSREAFDPEVYGENSPVVDDRFIALRTASFITGIRTLVQALQAGPPPDPNKILGDWIRRSLLNSFGVVALTALQEYCGAGDGDVGYAFDDASWRGDGPLRLFLYDRSQFGNGSTAVGKRYLHIPHLLRHRVTQGSKLLPTTDYLSTLEEGLLQCPQFHTDLSALHMHARHGENPNGIRGLKDVEEQAREVLRVSGKTWDGLGIAGPSDAWKLPVMNLHVDDYVGPGPLSRDDLIRATTICWNGCPECVERPDLTLGGLAGRYYLDKAVLDHWFRTGLDSNNEYSTISFRDLLTGTSLPNFGSLHRVYLDLPKRRIRSSSLPWTIGLEIRRGNEPAEARLIMRVSDILDLRLAEAPAAGAATGIESVGFKRLLWFDLLLTAYLDSLGVLNTEQREIDLVYYDCRDLAFDDISFSPRMLESVLVEARDAGVSGDVGSLSDILSWLSKRGFKVRLCVDSRQATEPGVRSFLDTLRQLGGGNISIETKTVDQGSMHKKALVTPIAVLKGSANLTGAGSGFSEELIDHFFAGTPLFTDARQNSLDSFHGAALWQG